MVNPKHAGYGDLLILNLVSRKLFWMWKRLINTEIKAKVTDQFGYLFGLDANLDFSTPWEMKTGAEEIKIKYESIEHLDTENVHQFIDARLGSFKYRKQIVLSFLYLYR